MKNKERKYRNNTYLHKLLIIIFLITFLFSSYRLFTIWREYKKGEEEYKTIEKEYTNAKENKKVEEEDVYRKLEVDFEKLTSINKDIVGWIIFETIDISYPIVQADNNDYYLDRSFQKEKNSGGAIFADYRNTKYLTDYNTFIYGHNMKNKSMFGLLLNYVNEDYYIDNPYFWIHTPQGDFKYEIFSAYEEDAAGSSYQIEYKDEKDFEKYLNRLQRKSYYDTEVEVESNDTIITLSTCTAKDRFLVHGKRIE